MSSLLGKGQNERGVVTALTPGKLRQLVVTLIQDPGGTLYTPAVPIDLSEQSADSAERTIVRVLPPHRDSE